MKKLSKEKKLQKKAYWKNIRKTRKSLRLLSKEWCPFDFCYLFWAIEDMLEGFKNYYEIGYNIDGMEWADVEENARPNPCPPRRVEIATTLLELFKKMEETERTYNGKATEAAMKEFCDYFTKYIWRLWD